MKRLGLTATVAIIVAGLPNFSLRAESSPKSTASQQQIKQWIELLDHDDFAKREEASRQLVDAGTLSIPAVAKAAARDSQEVAWRSGVILQQIGISGDEAAMTEVIRAMAELEKSGTRSFKQSGAEIIQRWKQHRDDRAVAAVRRLGGEVVDSAPEGLVAFGGAGGFIAPPLAIDGPVILDARAFRLDVVREPIKIEPLKDLKVTIEKEAKPVDKSAEPVKPLTLPKLSDADGALEGANRDTSRPENKSDNLRGEFKVEEVERFVEELKKVRVGIDQRVARMGPDGAKGDVGIKIEGKADDAIELDALEDLFEKRVELAPAPVPVLGGGFGGGFGGAAVVWDVNSAPTSSRLARLGKEWKGSSADLKILREVTGLATLELHDFELDDDAIKQIARMKKLRRLQIQHSRFEREKLLALKRANPNLSIYAVGKTLLGVSGQPHEDGFIISHVVDGSAAHKAGVIIGDIVTQAEGIRLTNVDELTIAIAHKNIGDLLPITFKRNGELHSVEVKLGPRAAIQ